MDVYRDYTQHNNNNKKKPKINLWESTAKTLILFELGYGILYFYNVSFMCALRLLKEEKWILKERRNERTNEI